MARNSSWNWGIFLSVLISAGLVGTAYIFATGSAEPTVAEASTQSALLESIAAQDSDKDGLPDWEEALYGTDPHVSDTRKLGMTDGEAAAKGLIVPKAVATISKSTPAQNTQTSSELSAPAEGSLTSLFADSFLVAYIDAKNANGGADLAQDQVIALANKVIDDLVSQIGPAPDFINAKNLRTEGSDAQSLRAYAASVEAVIKAHSPNVKKTELLYLKDVTSGNDLSAVASIQAIAKAYKDTAAGIAVLPVPSVLANDMGSLINALARVGDNASDFARVRTDPVVTMFAIKQYATTLDMLTKAYTSIAGTYATRGVVFAQSEPGASFVNTMAIVRQNAAPAPSSP